MRAAKPTCIFKSLNESIDDIKNQIVERDRYDSSREISPLKKAGDAIEIDTSNLTIEGQTEKVIELASAIIKRQ